MPNFNGVRVPDFHARFDAELPTLAATKTITGATNANPIVITATAHGYNNGDYVYITAVGGNTAANGVRKVANKDTNTFEITDLNGVNVAGNGTYTSGGTAQLFSSNPTIAPKDFWLITARFNNTTGGALQANIMDGQAPGNFQAFASTSVAANSVTREDTGDGMPTKITSGAAAWASGAGLRAVIEGFKLL